jgi:hypothetical protein
MAINLNEISKLTILLNVNSDSNVNAKKTANAQTGGWSRPSTGRDQPLGATSATLKLDELT